MVEGRGGEEWYSSRTRTGAYYSTGKKERKKERKKRSFIFSTQRIIIYNTRWHYLTYMLRNDLLQYHLIALRKSVQVERDREDRVKWPCFTPRDPMQLIPTVTDAINWEFFLLLGQFLLSVLHLNLALCEGGWGGGGRGEGGEGDRGGETAT